MSIAILILLTLIVVAHAAFAYRYTRFSPWRATWQGITLLAQTVTLASLAAFFLVDTVIVGHWPGRSVILVSIVTLLMLEGWAALWGLLHVQRRQVPVPRRQGTGYVPPEDIENTDPRRSKK